MAVDQTLLEQVADPASPPTTFLRFYQWEQPTLSLGFSQKTQKVVDLEYCRTHGIRLVRRITGGKAVLHDQEITYSVISDDSEFFPSRDIGETYRRIAVALAAGFKEMGLETSLAPAAPPSLPCGASSPSCFAAANHYEILCQGKKLAGSAQHRTGSAFLQHGSILLAFDPDRLNGALGIHPRNEIASKVTSLSDCLGYHPDASEVVGKLLSGFQSTFQIKFRKTQLDSKSRSLAENLSDSKYSLLEWHLNPEMP
jgi:lipoate-protein ligase A